ncbi:hypothetical protein FS749_009285, partial [Ceratobasidium sp. UAMH 11750]
GIPKRKNRGYAKGKGKASTTKIPQKLLGPVAFSLERMLAILEALTLEYVDFPGLDDAHQREDMANLGDQQSAYPVRARTTHPRTTDCSNRIDGYHRLQ